jgi:hypothetical protein
MIKLELHNPMQTTKGRMIYFDFPIIPSFLMWLGDKKEIKFVEVLFLIFRLEIRTENE